MSSKKMWKSELLILTILMFGNRVFADVSKMSLSGWGPTPVGPVFLYHEDRDLPRGKTACCPRGEDSFVKDSGGRDWNHIATKPRNSEDCNKEAARKRPILHVSEGADPCQHLDFGLLASRTSICVVESDSACVTCSSSLRNTQQLV